MGAAIFGALFGPVVGAAAALLGRGVVFASLAGLALVLGTWALRLEAAPAEQPSAAAVLRALRNRRFTGGLLLMALAALLFGVLGVLAPLHLAAAGWGAAAVGGVWLGGAALEALQAPLVGRVLDRRGPVMPVRASLALGAVFSLGLATGARPLAYVPLIVLAGLAYGILFTPAFALIANGAEEAGLAQGMGFGLMNAAWATGAVTGPAAGGAIAGATGDSIPFVLAAGLCSAVLVLVHGRRSERRRAALAERL
jgi:MFS family permease